MTRKPLAFALVSLAFAALCVAPVPSTGTPARLSGQDAAPAPPADAMLDALQAYVGHLDAEQRQRIDFAFDADERLDWAYTPRERVGVPMGGASDAQMADLRALLTTGLGDHGTRQAFQIVALEELLYEQSGRRPMRDPGNYFVAIFGVPAAQGPWGWRFEGHHLSVSFTIIDNRVVSSTPAFFGGNPARVPADAPVHAGLAPFAREQELGWGLVRSFEGNQADAVMVAAEAPDDILTTNVPRAEMGAPDGVALADMSAAQRDTLLELLGTFARRMAAELANYQMAKIRAAGIERVHFAWAGGTAEGDRHYFRIHGPTFVIEWDNTQGNANHVHSVWRDFEDDFGSDPLRRHLAADHGMASAFNRGIGGGDHGADAPTRAPKSADNLGKPEEIEHDKDAHQRAHAKGTPHTHGHRR